MRAHIVETEEEGSSRRCGGLSARIRGVRRPLVIAAGTTMLVLGGYSQAPQPPDKITHGIILPEANRPLDANDQIKLHEQKSKKRNFDAANAERKRELDDASTKLLILAKDLKQQADQMETSPLTRKALREAEVIEMLARDVKEKMKLSVGGS